MQALHSLETRQQATAPPADFVPLALETRPTVTTAAIAFYTHSAPQTWRIHAMRQTGGILPLRLNGKLHWPTDQLRRLLGVSA